MYLGYVSVNFLGSLWQMKTECFRRVSIFKDQTHQLSRLQLPVPSKPWTLHAKVARVEPVLSTTFSWRFGMWSIIYVVWATFKQNSKRSSKKVSLISCRLFSCLIWHQKVVTHAFKSIFLSWMCGFVHACASLCAPICFGACRWHTSLRRQVATVEKCPWLLARSELRLQRGRLSPWPLSMEKTSLSETHRLQLWPWLLTLSFRGFWGKHKHL